MKAQHWPGYTLRVQGRGAGFVGTVGPELTDALLGEGEPRRFHTYARVIVSE